MRRLLRPGGRLAFTTILLTDGLTHAQQRLAVASGPPAVVGDDPRDLLMRAGFVDVGKFDVTADFLAASKSWRAARIRHRDVLRPLNPHVYDDRIAHGTAEIEAVEAGLLRRVLYVSTRPRPRNGA